MTTREAVDILKPFIGADQLQTMTNGCRRSEGKYFRDKLTEMAQRVQTMPQTYDQDGLGDQAVAHLHYFAGNCDWFITERDADVDKVGQIQAFGYADLGYGGELGYISIEEIVGSGSGVELDLHWTPKTIWTIKSEASLNDFNYVGSRMHY